MKRIWNKKLAWIEMLHINRLLQRVVERTDAIPLSWVMTCAQVLRWRVLLHPGTRSTWFVIIVLRGFVHPHRGSHRASLAMFQTPMAGHDQGEGAHGARKLLQSGIASTAVRSFVVARHQALES